MLSLTHSPISANSTSLVVEQLSGSDNVCLEAEHNGSMLNW